MKTYLMILMCIVVTIFAIVAIGAAAALGYMIITEIIEDLKNKGGL